MHCDSASTVEFYPRRERKARRKSLSGLLLRPEDVGNTWEVLSFKFRSWRRRIGGAEVRQYRQNDFLKFCCFCLKNRLNHEQKNHFLVKRCLFPVNAPSLNVVLQGVLFDGLKSFDIEVIREREFVEFGRDGFGLQGRDPPEGEVDIGNRRMATFGA